MHRLARAMAAPVRRRAPEPAVSGPVAPGDSLDRVTSMAVGSGGVVVARAARRHGGHVRPAYPPRGREPAARSGAWPWWPAWCSSPSPCGPSCSATTVEPPPPSPTSPRPSWPPWRSPPRRGGPPASATSGWWLISASCAAWLSGQLLWTWRDAVQGASRRHRLRGRHRLPGRPAPRLRRLLRARVRPRRTARRLGPSPDRDRRHRHVPPVRDLGDHDHPHHRRPRPRRARADGAARLPDRGPGRRHHGPRGRAQPPQPGDGAGRRGRHRHGRRQRRLQLPPDRVHLPDRLAVGPAVAGRPRPVRAGRTAPRHRRRHDRPHRPGRPVPARLRTHAGRPRRRRSGGWSTAAATTVCAAR